MPDFSSAAGQLFIVGLEGSTWSEDMQILLAEVRPGGVIFFDRNISLPDNFFELVNQIREFYIRASMPTPFLAVDLEGGTVDRFRKTLAPLPAVKDVARAGLARRHGQLAGREAAAFSLNIDFAPVLDLAESASKSVMGNRTAGESPEAVIAYAKAFLDGLAEQGIVGCAKHFPGLGSGTVDSHHAMPRILKSAAKIWEEDLLPYRALAASLPMIMVAHAWYPALEKEFAIPGTPSSDPIPASLSPALVTGLLKGKIAYGGLVVSDDLEMGGVLEGCGLGVAAVRAIRAGCDILLVCRRAECVREAVDAVLSEASRDSGFRSLVGFAAQKILRAKETLGVNQRRKNMPSPNWDDLRMAIRSFTADVEKAQSQSTEEKK